MPPTSTLTKANGAIPAKDVPARKKKSPRKKNTTTKNKFVNAKPKRPLTAYNLFFSLERDRLIAKEEERMYTKEDVNRVLRKADGRPHRKSHGQIGFHELTKTVCARWKKLTPKDKAVFSERAKKEKDEYFKKLWEWQKKQADALLASHSVTLMMDNSDPSVDTVVYDCGDSDETSAQKMYEV